MKTAIMQAAIQPATVAVRMMQEADQTNEPPMRRNSPEECHRQRQAGLTLRQPTVDWKAPDKYVELLNFKLEVANILQIKAYDLNDEEKVAIIKNGKAKNGCNSYRLLLTLKKIHTELQQDCSRS